MDYIDKNIDEYNSSKKRKILIVFDDLFADMLSNKNRNLIVIEFFIRGRKPITKLDFIAILSLLTQSYIAVSKNIRLDSTHYLIMKIPNKQKLQQIALNFYSDSNFRDFRVQSHILFSD